MYNESPKRSENDLSERLFKSAFERNDCIKFPEPIIRNEATRTRARNKYIKIPRMVYTSLSRSVRKHC